MIIDTDNKTAGELRALAGKLIAMAAFMEHPACLCGDLREEYKSFHAYYGEMRGCLRCNKWDDPRFNS